MDDMETIKDHIIDIINTFENMTELAILNISRYNTSVTKAALGELLKANIVTRIDNNEHNTIDLYCIL